MSRFRTVCRAGIRSMSSIFSPSGRTYPEGELFRRHPFDAAHNIYKTQFQGKDFVYKRVSESFFRLSEQLAKEFAGARHLRMHTDCNANDLTLIHPYFKDTMLSLFHDHSNIPKYTIKKMLRCTSEALKELHDRKWVHIDVKPDNIMVEWYLNDQAVPIVTDVALSDFDISRKLENGATLRGPHPIGSIFWRSPEGQTGKGMAKASDVYSPGLVFLFAFGGKFIIVPKALEELLEADEWALLHEILVRHFLLFGPVPDELLSHVDDDAWGKILTVASRHADDFAAQDPLSRIALWSEDTLPHLDLDGKSLLSMMLQLDPAKRPTIDKVLAHEWWTEDN